MSEAAQLNPTWWPRFWRSPLLLAICALVVTTFWWTGHWMTIRWDQPNSYYSHGWLVPAISAVLVYRKRKRLSAARVRPCLGGLGVLLPSLLLHLLGTAWQVGFLSGFAMLGVLGGLVLTLFGPEVLRVVLFPLLFLAFMVPLPVLLVESVSFRLKLLAARLAVAALDLAGMVAVRQGSYIRIPAGTVIVDDVCSGLKYLISLMAFGALYAHISSVSRPQKAVLFLLSIPIAFVANVFRVVLMVVIAYFWGVATIQKWYFHDTFGFMLFAAAFLMLFATEALFLKRGQADHPDDADRTLASGAAARKHPPGREHPTLSFRRMSAAVSAALLVSAALSVFLAWPRPAIDVTDMLAGVPLDMEPWQGRDIPLDERTYAILGTRDVLSRAYSSDDGRRVQIVVVLAQQARRRTHPPEQCYTGEGFVIRRSEDRSIAIPTAGRPIPLKVRELALERADQERLVWYFYKSGTRLTTSYWRHQARVAFSKLAGAGAADVLIRVDTEAPNGDLESSRQVLANYLSHALPHLLARLP